MGSDDVVIIVSSFFVFGELTRKSHGFCLCFFFFYFLKKDKRPVCFFSIPLWQFCLFFITYNVIIQGEGKGGQYLYIFCIESTSERMLLQGFHHCGTFC